MEWIKEWLSNFLSWLIDILLYIPQKLFDLFLDALVVLLDSLPLPGFITDYSLTQLISPDLHYFLSMSGLDVALGIVGGAYIFYFLRRVLTLGIW